MPRFRITAPDGRSFTVEAPEGTTREQALARVRSQHSTPGPRPQTMLEKAAGFGGTALDAMLPGFAGASRGTRNVLVNALEAPFDDKVDFDPGKVFRQGQREIASVQKRFAAENPKTASAGTGTGIGLGFALPMSKIPKAASLPQKAWAGVKTSGAYGALSGAMSSTADNVSDFVGDVVSSAGTSATVGAVSPYAFKGAGALAGWTRPLYQPATRMIGRGLQGLGDIVPGTAGTYLAREGQQLARDPARATAHQQLAHDIRASSHPVTGAPLRPRQVAPEVARRQHLGVPAVAADLGEGLQRRFGSAARTPGPATAMVRRRIDERQRQEPERAVQHLRATLGPVGNVEQQAELLNREARAAAAPLYEAAYAQDIPVTQEMQELFSRPGPDKQSTTLRSVYKIRA